MKKVLILFFLLISISNIKSQNWQVYSDSLYKIMQVGDWNDAYFFIDKIDSLLLIQGFEIDTNYADYLYRKGTLLNSIDNNYTESLENILESEKIWQKSKIKNYSKLMFIYYWKGLSQFTLKYDKDAIKSYRLSIDYNIQNDTINQFILLMSNFYLGRSYEYLNEKDCKTYYKYFKKVLDLHEKYKSKSYYAVYNSASSLLKCTNKYKDKGFYYFKMAEAYQNLEPDSFALFNTYILLSSYNYILEKDWLQSKHVLDYAEKIIADKNSIYYADLLAEYGIYYWKQDLYAEANVYNLKALEIYSNSIVNVDNKIINLNAQIGLIYWVDLQLLEAIEYYVFATSKAKVKEGFDQERINDFYRNISHIYNQIGDNIKSKEYLILSNKNYNSNEVKDGDFYETKAEFYLTVDDFDNALESILKAEELYKDSLDYEGLYNIYSLSLSLSIQNKIFKNDKARYFFDLISEIKPFLDEIDKLWATALEVDVLTLEFEFSKANEVLIKVDSLVQNLEFNNLLEYTDLYVYIKSALGSINFQLGDYKKGFEQTDIAIEYLKQNNDDYNINLLEFYLSAGMFTAMYMPEFSMKYLTPAKEIIDRYNLLNTNINAKYLTCVGFTFANLGNVDDAYVALTDAINIFEKAEYIENIHLYTSANIKLAQLDINAQAQFPEKDLFQQASKRIDYSEKIALDYGGNNTMLLADVYATKSVLLLYSEKFDEANEYFVKSIKIYEENEATFIASEQKSLYAMSLYFDKKETKAIEILESIVGDENLNVNNKSIATIMLYRLYYNHFPNKAIDLLFSAIEIDKKKMMSGFQYMSDSEKQKHLSGAITNRFEWLNSHLLSPIINSQFLFDYMNARSFYRSILLSNSNKKVNKLIRKKEFEYLSSKFDELNNNRLVLNGYIESNKNINDIKKLEKKIQELERFITYELQKSDLENDEISYDMIVNNLLDKECYVEIIRINKAGKDFMNSFTDSISYAAIIISNNKDPELIILDSKNIFEKKLLPFYSSFMKANNNSKDNDSYGYLFEKIIDKVGDDKTIYLSPDGIYNNISIATLFDVNKEKYLLETSDIRIVSSARGFVSNKTSIPIVYNNNNINIIGNPKFDLSEAEATFSNNDSYVSRDIQINDFEKFTRFGISQLPGTAKEINDIKNLFDNNGWTTTLSEGIHANETKIKKVNSPRVLHIATHGFFFPTNDNEYDPVGKLMGLEKKISYDNPLMRSGLLFSGAQNTIRGENLIDDNGVLSSLEARELDLLETELVVLSACETGVGDFITGEGVYGLQRSILESGAKNVIMSLWKVDDAATQILMTTFYKNWIEKGMTKRESLKQAQITVKNTDGYSSPYYWGAFVLIGK